MINKMHKVLLLHSCGLNLCNNILPKVVKNPLTLPRCNAGVEGHYLQPTIALYFELETVLKFYNLDA